MNECAYPWTQSWYEVGYRNDSLGMPSTLSGRLELLERMANYLSAHQSMEVPAVGVTHAVLKSRYDALAAAINTLKAAWSTQRGKTDARKAPISALRARLRGLFNELRQILSPTDSRWTAFGFNPPGDNSTPQPPANLAVTDGLRGHLVAQWASSTGAARYRVRKRVVGVDPTPVLVKTTYETEADLNTFVSGQHVVLEVSALNSAGESLPTIAPEHVIP